MVFGSAPTTVAARRWVDVVAGTQAPNSRRNRWLVRERRKPNVGIPPKSKPKQHDHEHLHRLLGPLGLLVIAARYGRSPVSIGPRRARSRRSRLAQQSGPSSPAPHIEKVPFLETLEDCEKLSGSRFLPPIPVLLVSQSSQVKS